MENDKRSKKQKERQPDLFMGLGDKSTGVSVRCLRGEPGFQIHGSRYEILNNQAYNDWAERYVKLNNRRERFDNIAPRLAIVSLLMLITSAGYDAAGKEKEAKISFLASAGVIITVSIVSANREHRVLKHATSIHDQDWIREIHQ